MRASLLALLAASSPAFAQNASDYLTGLFTALSGAGLTRLVNSAQTIANTTTGQALITSLPSGNNTVFAPNDNAFNGTHPENLGDPNILAEILSYHVVHGTISTSNISSAPSNTILRTYLNNSQWAQLEGGKGQVLALSNVNGTVHIIDQNTPVQVVSSTTYQNLVIHVVDAVIDPPPTLSAAVQQYNLSSLAAAAQQGSILPALEATHGITIFAPTDAAFNSALSALGGANNVNQSTIATILGNHVINGTSAYSTTLASSNYTSAAGEPFSFATNSSGSYVSSGSSTARIVTPDVLLTNGVLHIIDGVLLNTESNAAAASSAEASATSVAAQTSTQTGPVGGPTSSSGSNGGNNKNGAVSIDVPVHQWTAALLFSLGGVALVL